MDRAVESPTTVACATLEGLLFAQVLRPLAEAAGPAGEYCIDTFAAALTASMVRTRG